MSEFLTIQVGQCGNQIGSSLWPEILQEYGISMDAPTHSKHQRKLGDTFQQYMQSFFRIEDAHGELDLHTVADLVHNGIKAKAICIDMEDSVVSRFKCGPLKGLFDRRSLITNYPGSGNNWAEGFWAHGTEFENVILDNVQKNLEKCDSLQAFLLLMSSGGGTGSGLGSFISQLLADHFPLVDRIAACVYPLGTEDVITCPYNMAFTTQQLLQHCNCVFPIENRALMNILVKRTQKERIRIKNQDPEVCKIWKPFEDLNRVIVNMLLSLTSGSRFPGAFNLDISDLSTNMVPFPRMNFVASGLSTIPIKGGSQTSITQNSRFVKQEKDGAFTEACSRDSQLLKIDPVDPKHYGLCATLLSRGDYTVTDLRQYADKLKTKSHFASCCHKNIRIGLCHIPPPTAKAAILSLFNTTGMASFFERLLDIFNRVYQKRAHTHHYLKVEGFENDHFEQCREDLSEVIESYHKFNLNQRVAK